MEMDSSSQPHKMPMWEWPFWKGGMLNPFEFFTGPRNLAQSILPGWVFGGVVNVTEQNSSAPDTEREIVAAHSYGRQLGRVIDAVVALVTELPKHERDKAPFVQLMAIHKEIDDIKLKSATKRLDRIATDLAVLKKENPDEYDRVAAKLREMLRRA
jgi:hypothetical protein